METPLVSIIVPCYNQGEYIAEALESVECQTYSNWECIIVDDGSTDNSKSEIKKFVDRDDRFRYIYQDNQGVVSARNNAIAASDGKYILPLDGDDKIVSTYLEMAVPILENDDNVGLVYCDVETFGIEHQNMWLRPVTLRNILAFGCCVNASVFRRKDFDIVGGFKEYMHNGWEDWEFFISIIELGRKAEKIERVLFYYRILPISRDRTIENRQNLHSEIVSRHAMAYYTEYVKLLEEHEIWSRNPTVCDTISLLNGHPFFYKIIHLNLELLKLLRKFYRKIKR